jgi:hypothetical protein
MKKREFRFLAVGMLAMLALSICACNSQGTNEIDPVSAKLSKNMVLKKAWRELPVPIYMSNSVPERLRPAILEAMEMWNGQAGVAVFEYVGETPNDVQARDDLNGIYWDRNPSEDGYFGEAKMVHEGDVMIEADVVFYGDPDEFDVLSCEGGEDKCVSGSDKKDIMTTALHELGHVLGFGHTDGEDEIMNPNFSRGDVHRGFDAVLIAELSDFYAPIMVADAR